MGSTVNCINNLIKADFFDNTAISIERSNISFLLDIMRSGCNETYMHCVRVSYYSVKVGYYLGLSMDSLNNLLYAAMVHDFGKIFIPKDILRKPGKLTEQEYEIVKAHSLRGYNAVKNIEKFNEVSKIILHHHERYDGKGYPYGLKGDDILYLSRILTITDCFDAMISERIYKKRFSVEAALGELEKEKWKQFDGELVSVFKRAVYQDENILEEAGKLVGF